MEKEKSDGKKYQLLVMQGLSDGNAPQSEPNDEGVVDERNKDSFLLDTHTNPCISCVGDLALFPLIFAVVSIEIVPILLMLKR